MNADVLRVTLIDVGWGDSILLEAKDEQGDSHYALIDSNDTANIRSSYIFLKRFFEREIPGINLPTQDPLFDWVLLTHAHADHGQGLKRLLREFGTHQFWYPKSNSRAVYFTDLLRYARRSSNVRHHQAVDKTKQPGSFGKVAMEFLWPPHNHLPPNENNNSVVMSLTLGDVAFVLTGDAESDVWRTLAPQIPNETVFFKVPHHGSDDAMFDSAGNTPWLTQLGGNAQLGISSHVRPFSHPSSSVVRLLNNSGKTYYRTDKHYHITVATDGQNIRTKYSHG